MLLSIFLPFVKIPYTVIVEAVSSQVQVEMGPLLSGIVKTELVQNSFFTVSNLILLSYLAVATVLLIFSMIKISKIYRLILGKKYKQVDKFKVIVLEKEIPAFTFFGYIVISREEFTNESYRNILAHEKVHAQQKHWIDLLFVELMTIVFWFNPFVWLFQLAIKQTHELLADDGVISRGFNIGQYQAQLINQLMGAEVVGLANNFNYSINKKRMIMMSKDKSHGNRRYKLLLMVPAILLVIGFNIQIIEVQAKGVEPVVLQKNEDVTIAGVVIAEDNKPMPGVAVLVENSTLGTVTDIYGKFELQVAKDANLMISFIGMETRKMAVEDFILNGKIKENYFLKIKLKADKGNNTAKSSRITKDLNRKHSSAEGEIFVIVEQMPEYPGGQDALREYFKKSTNYPKSAKENGVKGRVYVTFVIDKEGNVTKARVVRGVNQDFDKEALRVVKAMPKWVPGRQRGEKVNVSYTVPINFGLKDGEGYGEVEKVQFKKGISVKVGDAFTSVDEMPIFPGGQLELQKFIARTVKYPEEAQKKGETGRVFVTFIVNKLGVVDSARIVRGVSPSIDAEALRVVKAMPKWKPGKMKGEPVNVVYTVPINFELQKDQGIIIIDKLESDSLSNNIEKKQKKGEETVFVIVEEMPEYPGGHKKLKKFIEKKVKALDSKYLTGTRCFVSFVVNKKGEVVKAKVTRGTRNKEIDAIALRIVNSLPIWKPGKQSGQKVSVSYTVPIYFKA
ncbi:TonB family protein [Marinifilum sp. RC60d5]|uniref:TonB family protein n=1 Tax=Marinifilum sp. RC60d5 TaxID=3458414 RepID=UPI0040367633